MKCTFCGMLLCLSILVVGAFAEDSSLESTPGQVMNPISADGALETAPTQNESGTGLEARPYWEGDSLEALADLLESADGRTSYQVFSEPPAGYDLELVYLDIDGSGYYFQYGNADNRHIALHVFATDHAASSPDLQQIDVDGSTYQYHEAFGENGELVGSYFLWHTGNADFVVHPNESISAEVIRKYNKMMTVEFNTNQQRVGFGTSIPLIADLDKIEAVMSSNAGISYHMGTSSSSGHE